MFNKLNNNSEMRPHHRQPTLVLLCLSLALGLVSCETASPTLRVLLVDGRQQSQERLRAVEDAASLSIDGVAGGDKASLASLTLQQQHHPAANGSLHSPGTYTSTRPPAASTSDPWTELRLARLRPSWLNVSSQFKISGSTAEEVEQIMPAEYLLRPAFDAPILLRTRLGILEGVRSIRFNKHLYTFLSVPYARAPIGELRFRGPEPYPAWEGILQATKWPPFCVQPSMTLASKSSPVHVLSQTMSEDCLYMNIWSPSLKSTVSKQRKRPVMVWIHGGAFQYGGISVDENDASALALLGDVVVVTFNYRISALGFLNANNPGQAPNNVGLHDQRAAMQWVQANIKHFGGDPQQVTLFGESAGGHSVGLHMISPASQPLFKRAILQSGVPISLLRSYDVNSDNTGPAIGDSIGSIMMAKRLNCYDLSVSNGSSMDNDTTAGPETSSPAPSGNLNTDSSLEVEDSESSVEGPALSDATIECMRNKSSIELLLALGAPGSAGFFPTGNDLKGMFPNGPIMDSFDPAHLQVGPQKEYLIGTNVDEGTFMLHYALPSVFPARKPPTVDSVDTLKQALKLELERLSKSAALAVKKNANSSGSDQPAGAQAHLYKPLLRTGTSILEGFMPKSHVRVLENGTVVGNTTVWSKQVEFGKNIASFITDIIFLCPARSLARTLAESKRNVFFYLYGHRSSRTLYHEWLGVTHHDEVEFVFGRPLRLADVYTGKDIEMSQRLIKTWSHFAYTGTVPDQLGVPWPKYDPEDNQYMYLAPDEVHIGERYHDKLCNVYDTVISVHLQDA